MRGWVDIASSLKFLASKSESLANVDNDLSLIQALEMAGTANKNQPRAIERAINQYFATGNESWVLPIVAALETRGFYREMIEFIRIFSPSAQNDSNLMVHWNEFRARAVRHTLKMVIDPQFQVNKLMGRFLNIGEFPLRKIKLTITLNGSNGNDQSFQTKIFPDTPLGAGQEKKIEIVPPAEILVHLASGVTWRVDDVEVKD